MANIKVELTSEQLEQLNVNVLKKMEKEIASLKTQLGKLKYHNGELQRLRNENKRLEAHNTKNEEALRELRLDKHNHLERIKFINKWYKYFKDIIVNLNQDAIDDFIVTDPETYRNW